MLILFNHHNINVQYSSTNVLKKGLNCKNTYLQRLDITNPHKKED